MALCLRVQYTDASKTTNNKTSAAFCIPELNIELSVRLSDNVTIFAAEVSAIKLALLCVISNSDQNISNLATHTAVCKL